MALVERMGLRGVIRSILVAVSTLMLASAAAAAPVLSPGIDAEAIRGALQSALNEPASPGTDVLRFYGARDFRPAWIGNPAADAAVAAMEGADADGLDPGTYHARSLAARSRLTTAEEAAQYDIALTDGVLRYAKDLRRGMLDPGTADRMVGILRPSFDPAASLESALSGGGFKVWLASLAPTSPEYARLKAALARYRETVAQGGWPTVPAVKKIALEADNPELVPLQRRLAAEDPELRAASEPADISVLEDAIRRFQARNGLKVDGVAGGQTLATLNISAADRVALIQANMERWRWLPHEFPTRYIMVNTADASLKVVDDGNTVLTSPVIVGKRTTPTGIFNANVNAVTINPPWDVPSSIARNEIMPKLRRNPAYLAQHHMVQVGSPSRIRQLPGADNALGYVKLEMPNDFSSYLHDTSSRKLFARDDRYLSHGCIRVQNIRPLASYVLTGNPEAGLDEIDQAIAKGRTEQLALDKPLPVYVLYWTAIAQVDGTVEFRPDVYGRDKRLIAAFEGKPKENAAANDASPGCIGRTG